MNIKNGVCQKNKNGQRKHEMIPVHEPNSNQWHSACKKCGFFPVSVSPANK